MKISGAVFDMDGTLLESMHVWQNLGERYLVSLGITPKPDLQKTLDEMSLAAAAEYIRIEYGLSGTAEEIISGIKSLVTEEYLYSLGLKPGAAEFLAGLSSRGIKITMATATDYELASAAMRRCGVRQYFAEIFTCAGVGAGKNKPLIYEKAAEAMGTAKAETVVFEDAAFAAKTAKAAGFLVCGMADKFEKNQAELKETADFYAKSFDAAEELIFGKEGGREE